MELKNYEAAKQCFELKKLGNFDVFLNSAEEWAMSCTDQYGKANFVYEDGRGENKELYYFDLVSPGVSKYEVYDSKTGKLLDIIVRSDNLYPYFDYDSNKYELNWIDELEAPVYSLRGFEDYPLKLKLLQDAVYKGTYTTVDYRAAAIDDNDKTYVIKWEVTDEFRKLLEQGHLVEPMGLGAALYTGKGILIDQSDACDWSQFEVYDEDDNLVGNQSSIILYDTAGYKMNEG